MRLLKRGAEADIYETDWFGLPAICKVRRPKPYRNPDLDTRLRRQRTLREASMLHMVKSLGVPAPLVYFVDPKAYSITMQHVSGSTLHSLSDPEILSRCAEVGRIAGLLHAAGIMHGDLTTSNFVLADRLYLIDMGLSRRTIKAEDWAVDMRLIKEILGSAHAGILDDAWRMLVGGYSETMGEYRRVLQLVSVIEGRGRYARVV